MLILVIGNKDLSSWSLRPWMLLKHLRIEFEEVNLLLDTPEFESRVAQYSPAGRVPVLVDGNLAIWDSLAICEYVNEKSAGAAWPQNDGARAHARSISAEMHSGFQALRQTWPMKALSHLNVELTAAAARDIARIDAIWNDCRSRYGSKGPWLFGPYSVADAMYAPVVLRFNTYGATLSPLSQTYLEHSLADPTLREWMLGAEREAAMASS